MQGLGEDSAGGGRGRLVLTVETFPNYPCRGWPGAQAVPAVAGALGVNAGCDGEIFLSD